MHVYTTEQYTTEVLEAVEKNIKSEGLLILDRIEQFTKDEQALSKGRFIFYVPRRLDVSYSNHCYRLIYSLFTHLFTFTSFTT